MAEKRAFTMNEKYIIISEIESGCSQIEICRRMDLKKSTVANIWKNREKIKSDWKVNNKKKRMRSSIHPQVDEMLFKWFRENRSNNIAINGPMLQYKAEEFGRIIGDNFKCSIGWLDRFKKRHNIVLGKTCVDSPSVGRNITNDWISLVWPVISVDYSDENIFNAVATGIFYKVMPDETDKFKAETCSNGELSEERITVMACANSSGTEKRKLLIIGKYQEPRCLRNVKTLPADYCGDRKAWLTSSILADYLKKWDGELVEQKRKILLLVADRPAHPDVRLQNIKLQFFPPGTALVLQPMEQGVIWSFKQIYRKHMLASKDMNSTKSISLLDAINIMSLAWEEIAPETIRNAFRYSGSVKDRSKITELNFDRDDNINSNEWPVILSNADYSFDLRKWDDYVNIDNKVKCTAEVPDHHWTNEMHLYNKSVDEQEEDEEEKLVVTAEEALSCIQKLRRYFQQEDLGDEFLSNLNKMQLAASNNHLKNRFVQAKIADFFS